MSMTAVNGGFLDHDFSTHSTTTTTTDPENDDYCNWNDWSPVVDWEALSGGPHDDFHHLINSIMDGGDDSISAVSMSVDNDDSHHHHHQQQNNSNDDDMVVMTDTDESSCSSDDSKGLRLVHLLMAAAEALTGASKSRDLARVILLRLKELVSPNEGSNMERLAAYFTEALQGLLEGAGTGALHSSKHSLLLQNSGGSHQMDALAAFQLLQDMSPYVKFGHFTANQAILEAVADDRRIHIVDYDIMEGIQWASLMQALASRKDGPPAPHLRITALSRGGGGGGSGRIRSIGTTQETGRRLVAFAASIGQPFSFHHCRLDSDESFRPSALKLVKGEALIMNCMLHLPHFSFRATDSVSSFLTGAKSLNPKLITMVEEEVGPVGDGGFVSRFMDSLHHYSALYDSLEAGFPMQGRARALVEKVCLGPRIAGSLSRIYRARGVEGGCSWGQWLGGVGFREVKISFANHCQAKLLLGLFHDGYRVEELDSNRLVLGWKSRRLLSASIWTSPSDSQPDS